MEAIVLHAAGDPAALKYEHIQIPVPTRDQVLIKIMAFGLNRSELFTRQGHSSRVVELPRILGIECAGLVSSCPSKTFDDGATVVTAMGGLGRRFDGSYAQYTVVPCSQVREVTTRLNRDSREHWTLLGALPEMLQTAHGALFSSLRLVRADHLLIRGGTSSVGLTAASIAKELGCYVTATTRRDTAEIHRLLSSTGVDEVIVDDGQLAKRKSRFDRPVTKVLELVGTTTLMDSLQITASGGAVCMAGMVGNSWSFQDFAPMESIPSCVSLTTYSGGSQEFMEYPLDEYCKKVFDGRLKIVVGKTFRFSQVVEAHEVMESNGANGKIVILVDHDSLTR